MHCTPVRMSDGSVAIICGPRRAPRKPCVGCGKPSTRLCDVVIDRRPRTRLRLDGRIDDAPVETTCDAPVCVSCSQRIGKSEDRCPQHYTSRLAPTRQGTLDFGG